MPDHTYQSGFTISRYSSELNEWQEYKVTKEEKKFDLYLTVLRFLSNKITENLRRIYLDVDLDLHKIYLTAYYTHMPSELELELFDDIETNSQAHIPDLLIYTEVKLVNDYSENEKHDFTVFAFYEEGYNFDPSRSPEGKAEGPKEK